MDFFYISKKGKDERIVNLQNKIYREIYLLVMMVCTLSIAIKIYLYGAGIEPMITELIILTSQGIYYTARSTGLGLYSDEEELHDRDSKLSMSTKNIIIGIAFGVLIALFFGINSAVSYADTVRESIFYFFLVFLTSLIIYVPFLAVVMGIAHYSAKKRSRRAIDKKLKDAEDDR